MNENGNAGKGIFYGVIGVATLVVAIIGATFAYFTASATATGDEINGTTNNDLASALSIKVSKVTFDGTTATSNSLVPATITESVDGINNALTAKCENGGYTGCHLYKIEANTTQAVASASILLSLSTDASVKDNWKYVVYQGSDSSATSIVGDWGSLATAVQNRDIHSDASLVAGTVNSPSVTYYLLVYLANVNSSQNTSDGKIETGTYSGTVTMNAAGGQVSASFAA